MSLVKTQFVVNSETHLEEKVYRVDHVKLSDFIRRPNVRSTIENNDVKVDTTYDFHLRGTYNEK